MSVGGNDPIGREHNSSHKKDCRKIATVSEPPASFYPYSTFFPAFFLFRTTSERLFIKTTK